MKKILLSIAIFFVALPCTTAQTIPVPVAKLKRMISDIEVCKIDRIELDTLRLKSSIQEKAIGNLRSGFDLLRQESFRKDSLYILQKKTSEDLLSKYSRQIDENVKLDIAAKKYRSKYRIWQGYGISVTVAIIAGVALIFLP